MDNKDSLKTVKSDNNLKNYSVAIDENEYGHILLDLIGSKDLDKFIDQSVYKDNPTYRQAIIFGISIALMHTCKIKNKYLIEKGEIDHETFS